MTSVYQALAGVFLLITFFASPQGGGDETCVFEFRLNNGVIETRCTGDCTTSDECQKDKLVDTASVIEWGCKCGEHEASNNDCKGRWHWDLVEGTQSWVCTHSTLCALLERCRQRLGGPGAAWASVCICD